MNLDKKIRSIVITYEDYECVEITGVEAKKFQDIIKGYFSLHYSLLLDEKYKWILEKIPNIVSELNYTVIRHGLQNKDITNR